MSTTTAQTAAPTRARFAPNRRTATFLAVGTCGYLVDVTLFNVLSVVGPVDGANPAVPRTLAVLVALVVSYLGHRTFTWGNRAHGSNRREFTAFATVNACGFAFSLTCLLVSHELLGFTGQLADNIAANLVAPALGGIFRYLAYNRYVFPDTTPATETPAGRASVTSLAALADQVTTAAACCAAACGQRSCAGLLTSTR